MNSNNEETLKKHLKEVKFYIDNYDNQEASVYVFSYIQELVENINSKMRRLVIGKRYSQKKKVKKGFFSYITVDDIPDQRIFNYYLNGNFPGSYYMSHFKTLSNDKSLIFSRTIVPTILPVLYEDKIEKEEEVIYSKSELETKYYFPLGVQIIDGESSSKIDRMDETTAFKIREIYDVSNILKKIYFDGKVFRYTKNRKEVISTFLSDEAKYNLEYFSEFGYIFEISRILHENVQLFPTQIIDEIRELKQASKMKDYEWEDYLAFMMNVFSENGHYVKQNQILPIEDRGYYTKGRRTFFINADYKKMAVQVDLERFGSSYNDMVWVDGFVEAEEI